MDQRAQGADRRGETIDLHAFLTTDPDADVAPIHSQAMPAILTTPEEVETWLTAPTPIALQRPLPDGAVRIVARGTKQDGLPGSVEKLA